MCWTPKISKTLTLFQGATETSRLTWRNSFEHRSIQSVILGQIDQDAPGQPWVDRKSKLVKIIPKQHFSCFYIKLGLTKNFCQLQPSLTRSWLSRALETLILIRPLEWVETSVNTNIIESNFQWLFMGQNRSQNDWDILKTVQGASIRFLRP